jgi:hypothetical protein
MNEEAFPVLIAGAGGGDVPIFLNQAVLLREFMNKRYLKRK